MEVGVRNKKFGWLWLALFMVMGFIIEVKLGTDKEFMANSIGPEGSLGFTRELLRSAHAHGNLLAVVNILFAMNIDMTGLSDGLKNIGSWLAIIGAVILPLCLIGLAFGVQAAGPVASLGALALIAAIAIIAFGNFSKK